MVGKVVVRSHRVLDEAQQCSNKNQQVGHVDHVQEELPVPFFRQRDISELFSQQNVESNACKDEEPKCRQLQCQSHQHYVFAPIGFVFGVCCRNHGSSNNLDKEAEDVEAHKNRCDSSGGHPKMPDGLELFRNNPNRDATKRHVAGGRHDRWGNEDHDGLYDEDVSAVKVLDGHRSGNVPDQFH